MLCFLEIQQNLTIFFLVFPLWKKKKNFNFLLNQIQATKSSWQISKSKFIFFRLHYMCTYTVLIGLLTNIIRLSEEVVQVSIKMDSRQTVTLTQTHTGLNIIQWLSITQFLWIKELESPKFKLLTKAIHYLSFTPFPLSFAWLTNSCHSRLNHISFLSFPV